MAFDFKREYREFYLPGRRPAIVEVPGMRFVAVRGRGDPNAEDGAYPRALAVLYAVAYTLKMSRLGGHRMEGFFDYVVPPLEGFWRQDGTAGMDYSRKGDLQWISCIRLPDFVAPTDLEWAKAEAERKKKLDCSAAEFFTLAEGLCVQAMHLGPYDDEPETVAVMKRYAEAQGYEEDFSAERLHHEIYLSDPRRTDPARLKTVIRHPVQKAKGDV